MYVGQACLIAGALKPQAGSALTASAAYAWDLSLYMLTMYFDTYLNTQAQLAHRVAGLAITHSRPAWWTWCMRCTTPFLQNKGLQMIKIVAKPASFMAVGQAVNQ